MKTKILILLAVLSGFSQYPAIPIYGFFENDNIQLLTKLDKEDSLKLDQLEKLNLSNATKIRDSIILTNRQKYYQNRDTSNIGFRAMFQHTSREKKELKTTVNFFLSCLGLFATIAPIVQTSVNYKRDNKSIDSANNVINSWYDNQSSTYKRNNEKPELIKRVSWGEGYIGLTLSCSVSGLFLFLHSICN